MRYGAFLPKEGTIGFVAPSYGCNIEPYRSAFKNAQKVWKKQGYGLNLGPNAYEGSGIGISNTPKKCAEELMEWYLDEKNDVLISCGGGELMCGILEYMDFDAIRQAPPKWFMGFSDNTNMTFLLATLCDTAAIYGPCSAAFGMEPWHPVLKDAMGLLSGTKQTIESYGMWEKEGLKSEEEPLLPYNVTEKTELVIYKGEEKLEEGSVEMEGRLIGGCMDILALLCGTKYDKVAEFVEKYKEDGIVWFMESCDLNPMGIRRALWQLEQAGWFKYTKGFLIGRPYCFGETLLGMDQYEAVLGILTKYKVPIILDADLGHLPPSMPLVCGSFAKIRAEGDEIKVEMEYR